MHPTLFTIPEQIAGVPVFGIGWLLYVWLGGGLAMLGWHLWRHGWTAEARSLLTTMGVGAVLVAFIVPMFAGPGGLPIRSYGAMLLVAIGSAVGLAAWRAERLGLDPEMIVSLGLWTVVSGILGARAFYVIEYWEKFQRPTWGATLQAMANVPEGGLVVYGSLLAGGAALIVFVYKYHLPGLALADLVAPSVVLGMALGRLGCFFNGCCYGGQTTLPWALTFPWQSPPHVAQVENGELPVHGIRFDGYGGAPPMIASVDAGSAAAAAGLKSGQMVAEVDGTRVETVEQAQLRLLDLKGEGTKISVQVAGDRELKTWQVQGPLPRSKPIHPAQLYSFFDALLLCLFLLAYYPFRQRDGEVAALTMTIHPISRFLLEIIRVDESPVFATPWSISQNISIGVLIGAVILWIYILRRPPRTVWPKAAMA